MLEIFFLLSKTYLFGERTVKSGGQTKMKMIYNSCLSLLIYVRETSIFRKVNQQHVSTKSSESTKVAQFSYFKINVKTQHDWL